MTRMKYYILLLTSIIFVFIACQSKPNEKPTKIKRFSDELVSYNGYPDSATNLSIVNSEFDDYNSIKPGDGERSTFLFSSNRNSNGKDFDIIHYNALSFYYNYTSKKATVRLDEDFCPMSKELKKMLKKINSSENEFGPYILDLNDNFEFLFFYAQEQSST